MAGFFLLAGKQAGNVIFQRQQEQKTELSKNEITEKKKKQLEIKTISGCFSW